MVKMLKVSADRWQDFRPLADHKAKLQHFTKGEICELSAFLCSLQLMFDQTLINLIVCLMISQKLHTNKQTRMLQWILDTFDFSQN